MAGGIIPIILILFVGIIALTQEEPFQINDFNVDNEKGEQDEEFFSDYKLEREIPKWVKPTRWFRSNSGGMPIEEMQSRMAALRLEYALVIDFTNSYDLPEYLLEYYDDKYFIEVRTLFKDGNEDRTQWIFRDKDGGIRLVAVLFDAAQNTDNEETEAALVEADTTGINTTSVNGETGSIQNTDNTNIEIDTIEVAAIEIATAEGDSEDSETEIKVKTVRKPDPASGFVEIYDEKYHLTTEYMYSDKGEKSKIEYFYNNNVKTNARAMLWDDDEGDYIQTHTDYYRYNRSSFLRAVERVFMIDQKITSASNVVTNNIVTSNGVSDNVVKISFPSNILVTAKNDLFMGEKFNAYPEFFGNLFVQKDSKLIFSTDERGRVLEQTLLSNDEKSTVIWKIVNTWSDERIVKITKTEGETVLLAEYVYNNKGDIVLERNIKDGVLERVVRSDGKTDIEELYLNNTVVLQAVWQDGRKISESRVNIPR